MPRALLLCTALVAGCNASATPAHRAAATDSCAVVRPAFTPAKSKDRSIFAYDANAPLNLTKTVETTTNDIEVSRISFDSPGGGRVTGMMYSPATRSSLRPGLIVQHGLPGNARDQAAHSQMFAEYGAVVIALDAPFARRTTTSLFFTAQDSVEQVQLMQDLQRAVDVLRAQANVDPARIAYRGWSYGAAVGALFVGVEPRIKTAILAVGDGGLISHFTGDDDRPGPLAQLSCARRVAWLRAMTPIEPIRFLSLATVPVLLQSGRTDPLIPIADAEALHAAAPQPKTITWYDAGHGLNREAILEQLVWLHRYIGTGEPHN
jgi:uncharacterized protein